MICCSKNTGTTVLEDLNRSRALPTFSDRLHASPPEATGRGSQKAPRRSSLVALPFCLLYALPCNRIVGVLVIVLSLSITKILCYHYFSYVLITSRFSFLRSEYNFSSLGASSEIKLVTSTRLKYIYPSLN